jgi:hypothetical protein
MYRSTLTVTSALDGGAWSTQRPGRFTPGKDPVRIVQEAGWTPGSVVQNLQDEINYLKLVAVSCVVLCIVFV